jgi:hypothetical protein
MSSNHRNISIQCSGFHIKGKKCLFRFRITIKTRILLQRLINYNPVTEQPMYYQHHSAQIVHKDDERIDNEDLVQRQKLLAKEPEVPEK